MYFMWQLCDAQSAFTASLDQSCKKDCEQWKLGRSQPNPLSNIHCYSQKSPLDSIYQFDPKIFPQISHAEIGSSQTGPNQNKTLEESFPVLWDLSLGSSSCLVSPEKNLHVFQRIYRMRVLHGAWKSRIARLSLGLSNMYSLAFLCL